MAVVVRTILCTVAVLAVTVVGCGSDNDSAAREATSTVASVAGSATSAPPATSTLPELTPVEGVEPEAAFVAALGPYGVPVRNEESAVGTGQRICKALTGGESAEAATRFGIEEQLWTPEESGKAVVVAAKLLCPENADKVGN